jgi:bifunctional DNase/RNase
MRKIRLEIESLVYSQTQHGAYVLVLIEENGNRKLPIVIGAAEAQAIAIGQERMQAPRPLTHDLFVNFASAFNITLHEVVITKLEEGIFYAELICENFANRIKIDSRTSDAVALAVRFKCPIYVNEEVLKIAGISTQEEEKEDYGTHNYTPEQDNFENSLSRKTITELKMMLNDAVNQEKYELASKIRDEINRREK